MIIISYFGLNCTGKNNTFSKSKLIKNQMQKGLEIHMSSICGLVINDESLLLDKVDVHVLDVRPGDSNICLS